MRFSNASMLTNGSMSGTALSNGINVSQEWAFSIQANYTGDTAPAVAGLGTMKLQISNDNVQINPSGPGSGDPAAKVRNWCDYGGTLSSTSGVAGSSTFMWNISSPGFTWVRFAYVAASGTGVISVQYSGKGA